MSRSCGVRITFWLLLSICHHAASSQGSDLHEVDANTICRNAKHLQGTNNVCRRQLELIREVASGSHMAIQECKNNFKDRKWNCTTTHKTYKKILKTDTREAAYLNAITAAGILHAVTSACSSGVLWQCHCDRNKKDSANDGDWEWGGCSDDVQFGYNKSKQFTDTKKIRFDVKALVLVHNNEAGRLAITNHMSKVCKCHGLSGSCALETCWRKMPPFHTVGERLREKYDGSPKVTGSNDGYYLIPEGATIKPPSDEDLVYTEDSPDFCYSNKKFGTLGTEGRQCNDTSYGTDGCDILCCQRGYTKRTFTVREKCKCRFEWCCEVICETCISQKTIDTCK